MLRNIAIQTATRILGRSAMRPLNEALMRLSLRELGFECSYGTPIATQEVRFLQRVSASIGTSPVVFDIGANEGHYSSAVRAMLPSSRIIAVEPNPDVLPQLRQRVGGALSEVIPAAIAAQDGEGNLFTVDGGSGSNLASMSDEVVGHTAAKFGMGTHSARRVPVRSLDSLASELHVDRIDILKIDTEGHELGVLQGAQALLARRAIGFIQLEFNECSVFSRVQFRDLAEALGGYRLGRLLYSGEVLPLDYDPRWCEDYFYQLLIAQPR